MSYTIQEVNGCTKKFLFSYDQIDLSKEIKEALVAKQKTANLKGFRNGKAPLEVVQKMYGPQIESDALYRFVSAKFYDALKKEEIRAIGYPTFDNTKYEAGKKISFEATVEVIPEFSLKDYSKYSFKRDVGEVSAVDVENLKKSYLSSKAEILEVTDPNAKLEKGQFAVINFDGERKDGSRPDNMKATEYMMEVGAAQFIAGFEDGMIGMKKGEKRALNLKFPMDYHEEELRNEDVKFQVELLEIKEKKLPEFTNEMAKEFGFETVDDFIAKNKERMAVQKKRESTSKLQQEVLEKLIAENKFEIPSTLLEDQKNGVRQDLSKNLKSQGFNDQMIQLYFEKWDNDITQKAEFQVRSGLILDKLAKTFKVEATEADLDKKIDEMTSYSGMSKTEVSKFYKENANVRKNLMYAIREEKTFERLMQDMKIS